VHKKYSRHSLSFISGVVPLPAGLNSTPVESHKNTSMAPFPTSLPSTLAKLLASPLYARSLSLLSPYSFSFFQFFFTFHFFIFVIVHSTYSFKRQKRDPNLLREEGVFPV